MPKELKLFLKEELTFKEKFYKFMDLLISNQPDSRFEALFFMILNYLQLLSAFYSEQMQIFNPKNSIPDFILNDIEKMLRIKDLLRNNNKGLERFVIILLIILIVGIIHIVISCININNNSIYSLNQKVNNYFIKLFLYFAYNIIMDLSFSNFCFGFTEYNPNFEEKIQCTGKSKITIILISIFFILLAFAFRFILQIFYYDSFFLSNSSYSKMISNYDIYMDLNCL